MKKFAVLLASLSVFMLIGMGSTNAKSRLKSNSLKITTHITNETTKISGKTKSNALISIKHGKTTLGKDHASSKGNFTVKIKKIAPKWTIKIQSSKKKYKTISKSIKVSKYVPKTNSLKLTTKYITDETSKLVGTTKNKALITVKHGKTILGKTYANSKGSFTVNTKKVTPKWTITVQSSKSGYKTISKNVKVANRVLFEKPSFVRSTSASKVVVDAPLNSKLYAYVGNKKIATAKHISGVSYTGVGMLQRFELSMPALKLGTKISFIIKNSKFSTSSFSMNNTKYIYDNGSEYALKHPTETYVTYRALLTDNGTKIPAGTKISGLTIQDINKSKEITEIQAGNTSYDVVQTDIAYSIIPTNGTPTAVSPFYFPDSNDLLNDGIISTEKPMPYIDNHSGWKQFDASANQFSYWKYNNKQQKFLFVSTKAY